MIIVRLSGGLGNQMFQYAAGLRLALTLGTSLKLDAREVAGISRRRYALAEFNIRGEPATSAELAAVEGEGRRAWSRLLPAAQPGREQIRLGREKNFGFDPEVLALPDNVCLQGYWQSARYFADIRRTLQGEFSLRQGWDAADSRLLAEIEEKPGAVGVHVRRGDYVHNPEVARVHGVCPLDYYRACAGELAEQFGNVRFYVFSDEPGWVAENLALPGPTRVVMDAVPRSPHADLLLMSRCRHHIIANSTFSWWAAWLGNDPGKVVYAPGRWFADSPLETTDLLPASWRQR